MRYRLDSVDSTSGDVLADYSPQTYVPGPPARLSSLDGPGWGEPIPELRDVLDRYIALGVRGALSERPTFGEVLSESKDAFGASVVLSPYLDKYGPTFSPGGTVLDPKQAQHFVDLLGQSVPVRFGVRGRLIGQRDQHGVHVDVRFGPFSLPVAYVPPGAIAPFGMLFGAGELRGWEYVDMLDPPGYARNGYTIPAEIEQLMREAGTADAAEDDLTDVRIVPLDRAHLVYGIDHYAVWRDGDPRRIRLAPPVGDETQPAACAENETCSLTPRPPFLGEPLHIEMWPLGVDPFPEAVSPAELTYYPDDSAHSGRGVLVQIKGSVEFSGSSGAAQSPYFADRATDAFFRDAAQRLAQPARGNTVRAVAVTVPAVTAGVLVMLWAILITERERRRLSGDPT